MGVSWIFAVDEQQRSVEAALERAGAEHHGPYKVDCTTYRPTQAVQGQLGQVYLMHHSNYPDSTANFVEILNTPDVFARSISDQGFDHIIQKFSTAFTPDARFEVNGSEYHLKDFRVRVGTTLMNNSTKGVIVEFEFAASNLASQCVAMLCEMIGHFFPSEAKRLPRPLGKIYKSAENYLLSDTLEQYLIIFNEIRKKKP